MNIKKSNGNRYCHFFYLEIEKYYGKEKMETIKEELLSKDPDIFDNFDEKRYKGENPSNICMLIRNDSVEEFVAYVNRENIPLTSEIQPSIFETNLYLIEKTPTLIQYSAFYGSIQIFKFLRMSKVDLKSSLWCYSIHSRNAELIHLHIGIFYHIFGIIFWACGRLLSIILGKSDAKTQSDREA